MFFRNAITFATCFSYVKILPNVGSRCLGVIYYFSCRRRITNPSNHLYNNVFVGGISMNFHIVTSFELRTKFRAKLLIWS
jgi:hypothetical protein